ncbi:MAG: hypothetical protein ACD_18C00022G0001 [uncultured bacterium]|nr:MAG: hypothetical protein ACD_18C00022G0001 [uncultured bacterium]
MNVLYFWFGTGILIAIYGFLSLFLDYGVGWIGLHPFVLFNNFAPLGVNHNAIGEALVTILPLGFYLWYAKKRVWIGAFTIFILLISIATLSRSALVSILVSFTTLAYIYRQKIKEFLPKNFFVWTVISVILLVPIVWYISIFLSTNIVKSSNDSRLEMSKIAFFYIKEEPLLGHGPGTFIYMLADTEIFRYEYGDPVDSHGIIQKILLEEGVVGLLIFALFVYFILRYLWEAFSKAKKDDNKYLLLALFIMVISSLTFQLFSTSYFKAVLWLPLGISLTVTVFYLNSSLYDSKK